MFQERALRNPPAYWAFVLSNACSTAVPAGSGSPLPRGTGYLRSRRLWGCSLSSRSGLLLWLLFAALFWSLIASTVSSPTISHASEPSRSSMLTLGFDSPGGLSLVALAAAGVGLTLLALVIAYLPALYGAFSRREEVVTKLTVRTGAPPSGPALLASSWELGRFDQLEELWAGCEDWFIEIGEAHTTFPNLSFVRSPRASNHWVLAPPPPPPPPPPNSACAPGSTP